VAAGFIQDYRKELDSDIWLMPPLYHRVWQYLKYKANYDVGEIPMRDGSTFRVEPGQHLTSVRQIAKGVGWYEGKAWKEPNPKTIDTILKWLEKKSMISINRGTGNREYTLVTLINWAIYQHEAVSSNSKVTAEKQLVDIKNNKEKELKNITTITPAESHSIEWSISGNPKNEESPYLQILQGYCKLHNRFEVHVKSKEREAMDKMVAGGVPSPFTIRTMELLYEDKRKREEPRFQPPTSFLYYENAIWEAWENESITAEVPSSPVALGRNATEQRRFNHAKPRTGNTRSSNEYDRLSL